MCRRRPKAGASQQNTSRSAHLRQYFAGDDQINQDDPFDRRVNNTDPKGLARKFSVGKKKVETSILGASDLDLMIQTIRQAGYQVLGPMLMDQAIIYGELTSAEDLPQGWTDEQGKGYYRVKRRNDGAYFGYAVGPHSWKKFLQLPRRQVWKAQKITHPMQIEALVEKTQPMAFLGIRSCELYAIATQDLVFVSGTYRNESYASRREGLFTVAVNCTSAAATCFCSSMHTGPEVNLPCDILMTEVITEDEHYFLIGHGSDEGKKILKKLPLRKAGNKHKQQRNNAIQNALNQMADGSRAFDSSDVKELLYRNYESTAWDKVADRCLSCANCTMACPTCFCSTVEDTTDLSGQYAERWERWDSCFTADFSYVGGGSVRSDTRSRYRQWMTHKLATWYDQFGVSGCVGCGRCIAWCPVGIDITEEIQNIREADNK